ncbi:MAG: hypothetical protein GY826_42205, partial [Fuerstiella sp.]|nr:hypothetical protein [Fuerstiella sp.]
MRQNLEHQVSERLSELRTREFVNPRRTMHQCGIAAGVLLVALIPVVLWPSGSQLLLQRLLTPFANLESASDLRFQIEEGDRTVARGSDARIVAKPSWRSGTVGTRPDDVQLELTAIDGRADRITMVFDELSGAFVADILNISESVSFRVSGGGARTKL